MKILQEYFVYSDNYKYTLRLNLVGEFNTKGYSQFWYIEKNQFCTNTYYLIADEDQNIVGVRQKRSGVIDILSNDKNQPLES